MSRYIDAEKLRKDEIARCHCVPCVGNGDNNYKDLDEVLNDAPTADVVEVVRCKDCIHWGGITFGQVCRKFSGLETKIYMGADRYCSYGERREE